MEVIRLEDAPEMGRMCVWDKLKHQWIECWADHSSHKVAALRCSVCGKLITAKVSGWILADSGEVRCKECVEH
jgi:hypothetical protein